MQLSEITKQETSKKLCECGCGESIPMTNKRGEPARFKHGHNNTKERHWRWKGGIAMHSNGYRLMLVPKHPRANNHGYVPEQTLVMENYLGRYLTNDEEVHHLNEIKTDNRVENLQLVTHSEHTRIYNPRKKWSTERKI